MSELRSTVSAMQSEVLPELPDAVIEEDFSELHRAIELLETERLRRLVELERRGVHERDGHLSIAAWLVARFKLGWGAAREAIRLARALEDMPGTRRGLEEGDLSLSAAKVLAAAHDLDPDAFRGVEGTLVETARLHSATDLGRVAAYWRQTVENGRLLSGDEVAHGRRRLHASTTFGGMTRLDGELDPEGGETFQTALRTYLDAEARSADPTDDRTPAQRRADALVEICRQWLDLADRPTVAGERPHVVLTVDAKVLAEYRARVEGDPPLARAPGAADRCELDHVGPVSPEVARRLSCDASVMRVVMAGMSEPLDVGRRTKVISPALRRAVTLRDRRCRFPECDRPATWCDCHHVVHWADDGPTALKNLVLLCRRHHRLIHRPRGFRLEIREGSPTFLRPDGSVLEDRAPP